MSSTPKLTKKQKKALAFREHKSGKSKAQAADDETNDIPIMENVDDVEAEAAVVEKKQAKVVEKKAKGKAKEADADLKPKPSQNGESKKRKRDDDSAEASAEAGKKRKTVDEASGKIKQRFILFVGNLKYTTSKDAIAAHFAACDPPPSIRLLTPKPSASGQATAKSKGCAFLEFTHRNALQQGLKLHLSQLEGRMINVELTAGGGGKSEARTSKVQERNKGLHEQRKEQLKKESVKAGEGSLVSQSLRTQRFSSTSGVEEAPRTKKTWTIGDEVEDGPTHRGGKKHVRGSKKKPTKEWGSGANAIPVA